MTTLQRIRNHGALLIAVVGIAMLAFILGDFLNSGSGFLQRNRENIAVIEGNKVHHREYEAANQQLTTVYKIETGRSNFDEEMTTQLRNQVWSMLVMDYTMRAQAEKIGMDITADELTELCVGTNPHQIISSRPLFMDENGQFNRDIVKNWIQVINQEGGNTEDANLQQAKNYWMYWEKALRITYMQEKYTTLLQHMLKANSLEAQFAFDARKKGVSIEYVMQPYFAIADSLVSVSEKDIKALYNKNKEQYKQTPNRAIKYIAYDIAPSEDDFKAEEELMKSLKEDFQTAEDFTLVVNTNSEIEYNVFYYSESTVPAQFKDFAFAKGAKVGDCTDILFENDTYAMARIMQCGYSMPDSIELKEIIPEGEDKELGWFTTDRLPKNIAEKAFTTKRGGQFTIAQGTDEKTYEVMEVSASTPKVKLAILSRSVTPSDKTKSTIYNNAQQFAIDNATLEAMETAAQKAGLTVIPQYNLTENTDKVGQLKSSREIVRWAFEAKEGQVSDVIYECGQQFIIAALAEVNDGDYRSLESVRAELTYEATNNAKAAYIKEQLNGVETLAAAAEKLGQTIQSVERVSLADTHLGNAGMEPSVIGTAIALGENKLSQPIQGNMGVFLVQTGITTDTNEEFNAEIEKAQLTARLAYLPYQALQLIEDNADIEDNRANFQ